MLVEQLIHLLIKQLRARNVSYTLFSLHNLFFYSFFSYRKFTRFSCFNVKCKHHFFSWLCFISLCIICHSINQGICTVTVCLLSNKLWNELKKFTNNFNAAILQLWFFCWNMTIRMAYKSSRIYGVIEYDYFLHTCTAAIDVRTLTP